MNACFYKIVKIPILRENSIIARNSLWYTHCIKCKLHTRVIYHSIDYASNEKKMISKIS